MSNKRVLGNEFQTAYENAGGTDILKFLADVKQAYRCISDLTAVSYTHLRAHET